AAPAAAQRAEQPAPPQAKVGVPATAAIGRITLSPAPDQPFSPNVPWLAHRPDGTLVDCAGTQTSCFQEAENEAFAKGWSIDVYGPGGAVVSGINASRGIKLHPLRQRYIALHGILISCEPIDEPCLTVDSMVEGALILNDGAQITSTPKAASEHTFTILFQPRTKLDPEGFSAIASSRIDLGSLSHSVASGRSPATVGFDASYGNIISIGQIAPNGPEAIAYRDFGRQNMVTIGDIDTEQGPAKYGVMLEASTTGDQVTVNISRSSTRLSGGDFEDYGRDNTVTIDGKMFRNGNLTVLRNLPTSC